MKRISAMMVVAAVVLFVSTAVVMAQESGGTPETTDGFVCPVLGGQAGGDHGSSSPEPIVGISDGDSTVVGPDVSVPKHATNDDGEGSPGGDHASPGDSDYSAIWGGS